MRSKIFYRSILIAVFTLFIHSTLYARLPEGEAAKVAGNLEKMTVNTKIRFMEYEKYNSARSGSVSKSPDGNGCDQ